VASGNGKTRVAYFDTSALSKLLIQEPESAALRAALDRWQYIVVSEIGMVELVRSVRRADPHVEPNAYRLLRGFALVPLSRSILFRAGRLEPAALRSLDAIHLSSALALRATDVALVTYDHRLGAAARGAGLAVESPA
jgi:predicted nucleic acid-binding protein